MQYRALDYQSQIDWIRPRFRLTTEVQRPGLYGYDCSNSQEIYSIIGLPINALPVA